MPVPLCSLQAGGQHLFESAAVLPEWVTKFMLWSAEKPPASELSLVPWQQRDKGP